MNPSTGLAQAVARSTRLRLLGIEARSLVLPTTYAALETHLEPALNRPDSPDAILMIGLAARADRVRVERRATSRSNPLHPDAAGKPAGREPACSGVGARYTPMHAAPIKALLERGGVLCRASQDPGRYLCNAAYFRTLGEPAPALFLHIPKPRDPRRPRRMRGKGALRLDRLERAFVAVALALLKEARQGRGRPGGSVAAALSQG